MQWLGLIIPFIIAIFYKVKFKEEVTFYEYFLGLIIAVLVIFLSGLLYSVGITSDTKTVSGYVCGKRFIPAHSEIRTRITCDSDGDCTTSFYTVWIDDNFDVYLGHNFINNPIKQEASYGGEFYGNEGVTDIDVSKEKYYSTKIGTPAVWEEQFKNPLKKSKRNLYKPNVKGRYQYIHTPEIFGGWDINRVTNLSRVQLGDFHNELNKINSNLNKFNINLGFIIVENPSESFAQEQENYWLGGNPNDFIIFIGINKEGTILWVRSIAWGNERLKVEVREWILNNIKNIEDFKYILQSVRIKIENFGFTEMDFNQFNYIKVELPLYVIIITMIVTIIAIIFVMEAFRNNNYY